MECSSLPDSAFIAPDGSNHEVVAAFAQQVLDLVLAHAMGTASRLPLPAVRSVTEGEIIPDHPLHDAALLDRLASVLRDGMNPAHPGYVGHMDSMPALASILGEFALASVNNNMLSDEMSPAFSCLERELTQHFARQVNLSWLFY